MKKTISAIYSWLSHRSSYMLLTASDKQLAKEPPKRFKHTWAGLMLLSLGWGILSVVVYSLAWNLFGDYTAIPLMPVALVILLMAAWLYRRAILALAGVFCGSSPQEVALGSSVIVILMTLALLGLKSWKPDWPNWPNLPTHLQWYFHWIPRTMFRVLILAPLWGAWVMLITPNFCRPTKKTEPAVAEFIKGCGPLTAALCMAVPLAGTLFAFRVFGWWYLTVPAAAILAAVIGGFILCRRNGGPSRDTLLAANLLTQIVFILAYLALIR